MFNSTFFNSLLVASYITLTSGLAQAADNLFMEGSLVADPCVITPGKEKIEVKFGVIPDKNLYHYPRAKTTPFTLELSECDLSLGKTVRVSFKGSESLQLPGYLNITIAGKASGAVIGLETPEGVLLPINKELGKLYDLTAGTTALKMQAYVRGEPDTIKNENVVTGEFESTFATFDLEYE
ncbi:fimbrial protein [Serratia fonticola]|uniref:fimbrial protein n=1 Tax=Serratia fonticola TaxID=47917 RepID=UPI002DB7EE7D|nr:fimbrial protein [Serratia fonticola]MEB7884620.1 fimbrial protein [Serratia fonticola]